MLKPVIFMFNEIATGSFDVQVDEEGFIAETIEINERVKNNYELYVEGFEVLGFLNYAALESGEDYYPYISVEAMLKVPGLDEVFYSTNFGSFFNDGNEFINKTELNSFIETINSFEETKNK